MGKDELITVVPTPLLQLSELGIEATASPKLVMGALFNQFPTAQHKDAIGRFHRGQSMGNDNGGPSLQQTIQIGLEGCLG